MLPAGMLCRDGCAAHQAMLLLHTTVPDAVSGGEGGEWVAEVLCGWHSVGLCPQPHGIDVLGACRCAGLHQHLTSIFKKPLAIFQAGG